MSTTISNLFDDCLLQIFDQLPLCDLFKIDQVCQRWRSLTSEAFARRRHLTVIVAEPIAANVCNFNFPLPHQLFPQEKISILIQRIAEIESRSTLVFKADDDRCKSIQKAMQIEMPFGSEDEPHTMLARFVRAKSYFCQISEFISRTFTRINSLNIIIAFRNETFFSELIRLLQNRKIVDQLCELQIWNRILFSLSMEFKEFLDAISDCRRVKSLLLDLFGMNFDPNYNPILSGIVDKLSELIKLLPLDRFHISLHDCFAPYFGELAKALKRRIDKSRTMISIDFCGDDISTPNILANSILATASKQITHLYETIDCDEMLRFTSRHFTRLTYLSVIVEQLFDSNLFTFSYVIDSIEPLVELRHLVLTLNILPENGLLQDVFERSNAKNSDPTKPWPVLGSIRTLCLIERSLHRLPYERSFPGKSVFPAVVEFHFRTELHYTECLRCDVYRRKNAPTCHLDLCRTIVDQLPAVRRVYCAYDSDHLEHWNLTDK